MGGRSRRMWPWIVGSAALLLAVIALAAGCGRASPISTAPVAAPKPHAPAAPKPTPIVRQPGLSATEHGQ